MEEGREGGRRWGVEKRGEEGEKERESEDQQRESSCGSWEAMQGEGGQGEDTKREKDIEIQRKRELGKAGSRNQSRRAWTMEEMHQDSDMRNKENDYWGQTNNATVMAQTQPKESVPRFICFLRVGNSHQRQPRRNLSLSQDYQHTSL